MMPGLMMPKSLTAIVHVKFHYEELEAGKVGENELEILSRVLNQASELPPNLQEVLVSFVDYLNKIKAAEQSPS